MNFCFLVDLRIQFSSKESLSRQQGLIFVNFRLGFSAPHGTYLWHQLMEWLTQASGGKRAFWGCDSGQVCGIRSLVIHWSANLRTLKDGECDPEEILLIPSSIYRAPFSFLIYFCLYCAARGILVPWPGIEPAPLTLECGVLTTGPLGKSPAI